MMVINIKDYYLEEGQILAGVSPPTFMNILRHPKYTTFYRITGSYKEHLEGTLRYELYLRRITSGKGLIFYCDFFLDRQEEWPILDFLK